MCGLFCLFPAKLPEFSLNVCYLSIFQRSITQGAYLRSEIDKRRSLRGLRNEQCRLRSDRIQDKTQIHCDHNYSGMHKIKFNSRNTYKTSIKHTASLEQMNESGREGKPTNVDVLKRQWTSRDKSAVYIWFVDGYQANRLDFKCDTRTKHYKIGSRD